jgi:hypothetical protein
MTIWNILWTFGIIYCRWYSLWSFVIFLPIWYVWTKKNLATLPTGSVFRLAKYGESLRSSFERNVSRVKSSLPVRLPPDPANTSGQAADERSKSGSRNRPGNRPGSFAVFQERLMNSLPSKTLTSESSS